jgi:uncharacterized protein YndB with AHSA1/START domain
VTGPAAPVEVALTIAARPATIFRYFTDPDRFARWMGQASVLDPTPGGRLRVAYPTGQVAGGRVVAVEPDRRIVFSQDAGRVSTSHSPLPQLRQALRMRVGHTRPASWGYEGDGQALPAGGSTVEITLEPVDGGTLVRLRHEGLPAGEPPLAHLAGWRHALATLASAGSAEQLAPVLGERVTDWLAAWNEPDLERRAALLSRCLAEGGRYRDPTAAVDGAGPLADHIGMVQRMAGGTRLVGRGAPQPCHGVIRFGWAAVGPSEVVLATGTNVAGTDLDGRFRWLHGFWDPPPERPEAPEPA